MSALVLLNWLYKRRTAAVAIAVLLASCLFWLWVLSRFHANHEADLALAKESAQRAAQQAAVSDAGATAVERVHITERVIIREQESAKSEIKAAVGADALVPADVAGAWLGGIKRLREQEPAGAGGGDQTAPVAP